MLHRYATSLRARISESGAKAPSVDVIAYALNIVTNTVSIAALSLIIGILTGEFWRTAAMLVTFAVIRFITGGYHLKSGIFCVVVSTVVLSTMPLINLSDLMTNIFTLVACIIIAAFAPSNFDKYAWISEKHYPRLKVIAFALVSINFFVVSDILALTYILQASLLPFKEGGGDK